MPRTRMTMFRAVAAGALVVAAGLPVLAIAPAPASAAVAAATTPVVGTVLTSFRPGADDAARALADPGDGYVMVAGAAGGDFGVTRLNFSAGLADPSFGGDGQVTTDFGGRQDAANAVASGPSRTTVAAGSSGDDLAVARYDPSGALDRGFGTEGRVVVNLGGPDDAAYAVIAPLDGKVVAAGGNADSMVVLRFAADGSPDATFGASGRAAIPFASPARALVVQPDGQLVVAGGGPSGIGVARLTAAGTLDATFGSAGVARLGTAGTAANALALLPDGRLVVVGGASGNVVLARLLPNGLPDPTFGVNGIASAPDFGQDDTARGVSADDDGRLRVVGEAADGSGFFATFLPSGVLDTSEAGGFRRTQPLRALQRAIGGGWYVAGTELGSYASQDFFVGHAGSDGWIWPARGIAFDAPLELARGAVQLPDGRTVIAGETSGSIGLVRHLADGTRDPTFGIGGRVVSDLAWFPTVMAVQPGGRTVVVGHRDDVMTLVGFRADGSPDPTFGTDARTFTDLPGYEAPSAIVVLPDGGLLVAGSTSDGSFLARYLPDGQPDPAYGTAGVVLDTLGTGWGPPQAVARQPDGKLIAAGSDGVRRVNADGSVDTGFGTGGKTTFDPARLRNLTAIALQPDGRILVGGRSISDGFAILRLLPNGAIDGSWAPVRTEFAEENGGSGRVDVLRTLLPTTEGGVLALGGAGISRYRPDGTPDPGFGAGGQALLLPGDRDAVVALLGAGHVFSVGSARIGSHPTGFVLQTTKLPVGGMFHPLPPTRILDTRTGLGRSSAETPGKLAAGSWLYLKVAGRGGVPISGVGAVALNLTATEPTMGSFVTLWPGNQGPPNASNLNFSAGQTVANLSVVLVDNGGSMRLVNAVGSVHLVVDVAGWYGDGSEAGGQRFHPVAPSRVLDTREGNGAPAAKVGPGGVVSLLVAGRGGVPASGATAVAMNLTVTEPTEGDFVTVWPAGDALPNASNVNVAPGQTRANLVMVPIGAGGRVYLYNFNGSAHLVADVSGWFGGAADPTGQPLHAVVSPSRILDTRFGNGAPVAKVGSGATLALQVTGRGGLPASGVTAVVLNVTATDATQGGFVTAYPAGS
ncbi:MAG: hypothetical protein QOG43_402, partial [Actinomycetota bacterium]|nr:hypothetical protein [Actinomycetota bacterium]